MQMLPSSENGSLIRKVWFFSETALIPEDLMNISLEEVVFTAEWLPEVILPDKLPVDSSS